MGPTDSALTFAYQRTLEGGVEFYWSFLWNVCTTPKSWLNKSPIQVELGQSSLKEWVVWSHSDTACHAGVINNNGITMTLKQFFREQSTRALKYPDTTPGSNAECTHWARGISLGTCACVFTSFYLEFPYLWMNDNNNRFLVENNGSHLGQEAWFCPPEDMWQCLKTFLCVTTQGCYWVEAKNSANCPTMNRTVPRTSKLVPNIKSVKAEKHSVVMIERCYFKCVSIHQVPKKYTFLSTLLKQ